MCTGSSAVRYLAKDHGLESGSDKTERLTIYKFRTLLYINTPDLNIAHHLHGGQDEILINVGIYYAISIQFGVAIYDVAFRLGQSRNQQCSA